MLVKTLLVLGYWSVVLLSDIVDQYNTIVCSTSNQIRIFNTKLACCNLRFTVKYFLRKSWIL